MYLVRIGNTSTQRLVAHKTHDDAPTVALCARNRKVQTRVQGTRYELVERYDTATHRICAVCYGMERAYQTGRGALILTASEQRRREEQTKLAQWNAAALSMNKTRTR